MPANQRCRVINCRCKAVTRKEFELVLIEHSEYSEYSRTVVLKSLVPVCKQHAVIGEFEVRHAS